MQFRMNTTIEVDQVANGLAVGTPIPIQLVYQGGEWRFQCADPPITTCRYGEMEEALVAGAKEVAAEVQAAVINRPVIAGRITPDSLPPELR
jgi:hypothetical protein